MKISVVDVETANRHRSSICAIGIVQFEGQTIREVFNSLVNPGVEFEWKNIDIHGIGPEMVEGEPSLTEIASQVRSILEFGVVASHSMFDQQSFESAFAKAELDPLAEVHWLDICRLAKLAWPGRTEGYSLPNLARDLGYELLSHHVAIEDARAAAHVLGRAMSERGWSIRDCLDLLQRRPAPRT